MTSYDKVIKLACKPKAAPPKAKYLDPIIAATWSEDGAVHDVCKALGPRFREPNAIIVFKASIVLHTMIRNGATDNVLSYLSSSDVLRLQNVSSGNWEGYNTPQNLQHYAVYLESRIRAYRDLKHDAVRVQAESNRDMRLSKDIEEDGAYRNSKKGSSSVTNPTHQRSKTMMGRKLRVMTVEKGLLRETKAVQRMIDALVECRFYLDDLEDELTTTSLRMLVKDLLILFQAGNEGVINVLEHYFEMSHIDAKTALGIYRHFCKQTERVVEYLGVAKKLQNLLNVPIPNLKHAPVSLAGALQEYLEDPNFEQNRIEYKTTKESADKGLSSVKESSNTSKSEPAPTLPPISTTTQQPAASTSTAPKPDANQSMQDFFSAIEEEQPTMFNPQTGSPTAIYFQQQAATNPFSQQARMSGAAFGAQAFGMQQQPQQTGFIIPQQTASPFQQQQQQRPPNPFAIPPLQQQGPHINASTSLQPQATNSFLPSQPGGFLQPQATGSNPFRQSMMFPMSTGMGSFPGISNGAQGNLNSSSIQGQQGSTGQQLFASQPSSNSGVSSGFPPFSSISSAFASPSLSTQQQPSAFSSLPPRPASTPLKTTNEEPLPQFVKSHQTGTKNPFGVPMERPPPVPKLPTLLELSMKGSGGGGLGQGNDANVNAAQGGNTNQQPQSSTIGGLNGSGAFGAGGQGSDMASVASSFSFERRNQIGGSVSSPIGATPSFLNSQNTSTTATGSTFSDTLFSSLPSQTTAGSGTPIMGSPTVKPQTTGFGGIRPFKPTSSFGTSLLGSLPPAPQSDPGTPGTGTGSTGTVPGAIPATGGGSTLSFLNQPPTGYPGLNSQPTSFGGQSSSGLSAGLRPQTTGGAANPFRASMAVTGSNLTGMGSYGGSLVSPPFGGSLLGGQHPNGASLFGQGGPGTFGSAFTQDGLKQQPQNSSSLI